MSKTPPIKKPRLRIVTDGTHAGTRFFDNDTGKDITTLIACKSIGWPMLQVGETPQFQCTLVVSAEIQFNTHKG